MSEMLEGCGNHGCIIKKPVGMGTNGRCNCLAGLPTQKRIQVERKIYIMQKAIKAQTKLLACYRLLHQPPKEPEGIFKDIETARENGIEI